MSLTPPTQYQASVSCSGNPLRGRGRSPKLMQFLFIRATATDPDGNNVHSPLAHTPLLTSRYVTRSPSMSTTFLRGLSCFGELARLLAARNDSLSTLRPSCFTIRPRSALSVTICKGDPPAFNGLANFIARLDTYGLVLTLYDQDFHLIRNVHPLLGAQRGGVARSERSERSCPPPSCWHLVFPIRDLLHQVEKAIHDGPDQSSPVFYMVL